MKNYLVFRMYGPLASWGSVAVGEVRPSFSHPSKSAILGLVAAAMGYRRDEEEKHLELAKSFQFAVKVWNRGVLLRDYHTVQVPPQGKQPFATRKEQLRTKLDLKTILSSRDYYQDALYDVCLTNLSDTVSLEEIATSLQQPKFPLYLGRKSCVLAAPLFPESIAAETLFLAFEKYESKQQTRFAEKGVTYFYQTQKLQGKFVEYFWEGESEKQSQKILSRRDGVLSRSRWQFSERKEFYRSETQEVADVFK
ncbi:MAG: type I-E CRISPR-associated protein Cas5/CasD [Spirochaetota bacterium]